MQYNTAKKINRESHWLFTGRTTRESQHCDMTEMYRCDDASCRTPSGNPDESCIVLGPGK